MAQQAEEGGRKQLKTVPSATVTKASKDSQDSINRNVEKSADTHHLKRPCRGKG